MNQSLGFFASESSGPANSHSLAPGYAGMTRLAAGNAVTTVPWEGHTLELRFCIQHSTHTPREVILNGSPLEPIG